MCLSRSPNFTLFTFQDASGLPLLCAASKEGYESIVAKLLQLGADPCAQHKVSVANMMRLC